MSFKIKIVICGQSGLVGSKLSEVFESKHNEVIGIKVRDDTKIEDIAKQIEACDVLINLSGTTILARWSDEYKKGLYSSRINTTRKLVDAMGLCREKPKLFMSASAVGIYDSELKHDEDSKDFSDDFLANICKDWEAEARRASEIGVRNVQTRFGVIYAKEGGAMTKMLLPFKLGIGGKIGSGKQIVSWIHIDDLVRAYEFIIKTPELKGAINFTTAHSLSNSEQTKIMGDVLNRPTFFRVPEFILRLTFADGATVMLDSKDVYPKKLLESGFEFKYPYFEDAFREIIS
ncbi:epimerase [Sulfurimonas hongkongensis]|uniref:Epimerase n=1 Tax=Sulfurimonas hongkongensis TaxID=1172190 RepID=T0JML1_9BACT|nr:TIGR01777 family oxidoreductase [Sulfurimonas hongkongensis]EQB39321.1 epimerase [Sulfurimonas hongkongensis]